MRLIMDNSYTVVEFGSEPEYIQTKIKNNLRESLGVREDGYMYAKAYQLGYWDGVTEMTEYDKKTDTFRFPTGLIDLADEALGKLQETISFEYEIIDNRPDPLLTSLDLPESIKLEDGKTLRDYQYEAVKNTLEERYGIIKLATNSGKTLTAAGLIKESLPHLEKGETITFFTHSKELFRQSHKALEAALGVKVGKVGSGTFKPEVVNVAMVPTIASKLNIDVEKGVSFTPKQMVTKKMATILLPQFDKGINQLVGLRAYVQNMTVKTKADQQFKDEIIKLIEKSESDAKALFNLRQYNVRYQDILKKKNAEKYKEKKQYTDFLNSSVVVFGDECLVADTLIEKADGTFAPINTFKVGDEIKGGTITDVIERETETIILDHQKGHLEGSITHPTFIIKGEDYEQGIMEPKVEMLARVKAGDYVLVPYKDKNGELLYNNNGLSDGDEDKARFIALIQADGHSDKDRNRVQVNTTTKKEDYVRDIFIKGVKAVKSNAVINEKYDIRGNYLIWTVDKDVKKFISKYVPTGKKSTKIEFPDGLLNKKGSALKAYIETIFNLEGDLNKDKRHKNQYRLSLNSTSRKMITALQYILNNLEIDTTTQIVKRKRKNHNDIYRLSIGSKDLQTFYSYFDDIVKPKTPEKGFFTHNFIKQKVKKIQYNGVLYRLSKVKKLLSGEKQKVYDFATTSGTFIANNTLTHNCHRIKGDGYYNVMMSAENALIKVGLTGTLDETDKLLIQRAKAAFHNISAVTTNKEMIARGVSADVDVMLVPVQSVVHNGKEVRLKEKEIYQETYKNGIVHNEYRNALAAKITEVWYNKGETILLIVNQIEHGEIMSEYLESLNIPHQYIHGSISDEEREEALQKVREGENRVLISSTILDEGVDISNLSVLVNMAAGKSLRQVLQRVGRILRIKEDGRKATVIDFVDYTHTHLLAHGKRRRKIYEEEEFPVTYLGENK